MKITKVGKHQVSASDLVGNKCKCRNEKCGAEGEIGSTDTREITFRGISNKPFIRCPNCKSWMEVEK